MGIAERREREKEQQRNMRRQQIMEAAKIVFRRKGFISATMEDIAAEAELSIGALYLYFKNKDEIYASANISILEYLNERVKNLYESDRLNTEQKLEAFKDICYEAFEHDPLIMINVFHLQSSEILNKLSPRFLAKINSLTANSIRIVAKFFEDGINEGIFVDHCPIAMADMVWSLFSGLVLWEESKRIFDPKKNYLKQTLDSAFEIFNKGVKKRS